MYGIVGIFLNVVLVKLFIWLVKSVVNLRVGKINIKVSLIVRCD